ncbi:iron-containing alcohol dehydrogenase [Candidatus Thorarchaeota archaeon]|jgi:glycerol-1-phosphate dehydrogenase [NAD(P)+]|nr:MAG: iron-containing alcohol dehydrogenase [Candidatus Thorarchaeota archaeon]
MSCEPGLVAVADGALVQLRKIIQDYSRPLCVTDDVIKAEYGKQLEETAGCACRWVMASSYDNSLEMDLRDVDIVLGFGGGSSLDVAKLIARKNDLDWISIPTAASHDGIASEVASVSQNGYRYSKKCKGPLAVIADTSIISKAPTMLKLAGLGDIICKTSSLAEWRLAAEVKEEPFSDEVYDIVEEALESVLKSDDLESLIRAEIDMGRAMSIFGSSRPCSGTEHAISHAMDRSTSSLHGLQVAFATPLCLSYLHETGYSKYAPAEIQEYMRERKIPSSFDEMNTTEAVFLDDISHALRIMDRRDRYSVLRYLNVGEDSLVCRLHMLRY